MSSKPLKQLYIAKSWDELRKRAEDIQKYPDADEFHLRARKVEGCLQKLIQSEALSREEFFSHPEYSAISEKLMKEVWFAKESSELRLAGNLHAYL